MMRHRVSPSCWLPIAAVLLAVVAAGLTRGLTPVTGTALAAPKPAKVCKRACTKQQASCKKSAAAALKAAKRECKQADDKRACKQAAAQAAKNARAACKSRFTECKACCAAGGTADACTNPTGCGDGVVAVGEICDPPGSTGTCPGNSACTATCGCPTLLFDAAGNPTNDVPALGSLAGVIGNLQPYAQYDVTIRNAGGQVVSYLRLTADGSGTIPLTVLAYNLSAGTYTIDAAGVGTSVGAASLTFTVTDDPTRPQALPTDASGELRTSYTTGETVYIRARGLQSGAQVDLYVVNDQPAWRTGDLLVDRSGTVPTTPADPTLPRGREAVEFAGTAESVLVGSDGTVPPTSVWQDVEGLGGSFDVVVDVNRNGLFDLGTDVVTDHLTTGFVVQASSPAALGARAAAGDFLANLSHDRSCRPRDQFTPEDDVRVLVNPSVRMQLGGDRYVKKYIVAHKPQWNAGDALTDVSGPNSPWDADTVQSGCTNEGCVLAWPAPLAAGDYDVVIDVNRNDAYDPGVDILDGGTCPGFTVSTQVPARKRWTLMVYVDGDNNLEPFAISDLNEMETVGSTADVNIVVQIDRIPGYDASNGDWTDTRRYYVTADTDPATINSQQLACPSGELNMADPRTLQDFVSWAAANYPADRYGLVIWNHGRGFRLPHEERYSRVTRDIAWDDTDGGSLDMPEVEQAVRASGVHMSLLGYDACLMGMVEVARQMSDLADVSVFSQDLEPGDGWPYDTILADLAGDPSLDGAGLGRKIVERYGAEYAGQGGITYASVPTTGLDAVTTAMSTFATAMMDGMATARDAIRTARTNAQRFVGTNANYDDYRDLSHFASLVQSGVTGTDAQSTAIRTAAQGVVDAVSGAVAAETHSGELANAHGLTAWLPDCTFFNNHARKYGDLRLARTTQWDEFLATLCGQLVRVELSWGADPSDLDSHLWDAESPPHHMYYANKTIPTAELDLDDVTGFGPENTRITPLDGPRHRYDYAVHHYSGTLPPSGTIYVRVFRGSATVPVAVFSRNDWPISRGYWHVFWLDPVTQAITPVDAMTSGPPALLGAPRGSEELPPKEKPAS